MALGATIFRLGLSISDVDRGVYASEDLRIARHLSEGTRFLITRVLAWCLEYQEGLEFGRGLSSDDPGLFVRAADGNVSLWIDFGNPTPERIGRAARAATQVRLYTYKDADALVRQVARAKLRNAEAIELRSFEPDFLDAIGEGMNRKEQWDFVHTESVLYLATPRGSFEGRVLSRPLA